MKALSLAWLRWNSCPVSCNASSAEDAANERPLSILNEAQSGARLEEIRKSLPETSFAWSGPTTHETSQNGESYFRIHGSNLLIEHAPQDNQGGHKRHVHTIMRDLNNDYAKQLI